MNNAEITEMSKDPRFMSELSPDLKRFVLQLISFVEEVEESTSLGDLPERAEALLEDDRDR